MSSYTRNTQNNNGEREGCYIIYCVGLTIALNIWTFAGKVMSLLFNMLSRFVMERATAPHSSTLAWKIPWMEEPNRLQSMALQRVGHD